MKRRFSSYCPINTKTEYYAPRSALIESVARQLLGESEADEGGHYITIWAPRQTGKTWTMLEAVKAIRASNNEVNACFMSMESAKSETSAQVILEIFSREMRRALNDSVPTISEWKDFPVLFSHECLDKPLILINLYLYLHQFLRGKGAEVWPEFPTGNGKQLRLTEITLLFFIESISATHRETYERPLLDEQTGVTVTPVFVETGV